MSNAEEIIANTKATMAMEGLPLTEDEEKTIRDCLAGKKSFEEAIAEAVARHRAA